MTFQTTALILAWLAIALLGLALAGVVRQLHLLAGGVARPRLDVGPAVGSSAPPLNGDGRWSRPTALLFVERGCPPCEAVLPEFARLAGEARDVDFAVVASGNATDLHDAQVRMLANQRDAFERFRIPATPYAVVVGAEGTVVSAGPAGSRSALHHIVTAAMERGTAS